MSVEQQIKKAQSLPIQPAEEWVMERRDIDVEIEELGAEITPQILVCFSIDTGLILSGAVVAPDITESEVISWALGCMLNPAEGEPRRPAHITLVRLKPLQALFEQLGVDVTARSLSHPAVDEMISALEDNMERPGLPPYLDTKGVTAQAVSEFFSAAAEFSRVEPWELMEFEVPIKVEIKGKKRAIYWAVLMGMAEENYGLSLYRSIDQLLDILEADDDEAALEMGYKAWSLSFSYEELEHIGPYAQAEYLSHQWALAGESAFPSALVIDPGGKQLARRPNHNELSDLTAATRALAEFFEAYKDPIQDQERVIEDTRQIEVQGKTVEVTTTLPAPEVLEEDADDADYQLAGDDDESEDDVRLPDAITQHISPELARARELIAEALEEDSRSKRVKILKQAIIVCPDCAEAYVELAEDARDSREKADMLQRAVDAGRRAIGEEDFTELEGQFWNALETRPYVRARLRLAEFRVDEGDLEGAIEDYRDLLRLISGDILRVRDPLSRLLLLLDRDEEVWDLLQEYGEESSPFYWYSRALLGYRKDGESSEAESDLRSAISQNKHVVDYLLERKRLPMEQPNFYEPGGESEAIIYAATLIDVWKSTEGSLKWLKRVAYRVQEEEMSHPKSSKKGHKVDEKSLDLPLDEDVDIYEQFIAEHPAFADSMDEHEVEVDGNMASPRMHLVIHQVVENQLAQNNPPEAAEALERLMDAGMDRHEAVHAIGRVLAGFLYRIMKMKTPMDNEEYAAKLRELDS